MKQKVLILNPNGYNVLLVNPSLEELADNTQEKSIVIENPNLSRLKGVPLEHLKMSPEGIITVKSEEEMSSEGLPQSNPLINIEAFKSFVSGEKQMVVEVIKEVPVEVVTIKEVKVVETVEVIKEVQVIVEKIVNVEVPVIQTITVEKIVEVPVITEIIKETIKEVKVEVPVEITKLVFQKHLPTSVVYLLIVETAIIVGGLLIKLLV